MDDLDSSLLNELLDAVGAHLEDAVESASIVVVGGSTLAVRGWVDRTTKDVDVIAQSRRKDGERILVPAAPLPAALVNAATRVAEDYRLPVDWMNTVIGAQWEQGLPPGFAAEIEWRVYGSLEVGFAGRSSLIALKLFAVVDSGVDSVHFQDLLALKPTEGELTEAETWVSGQDAGTHFPTILKQALSNVRRSL